MPERRLELPPRGLQPSGNPASSPRVTDSQKAHQKACVQAGMQEKSAVPMICGEYEALMEGLGREIQGEVQRSREGPGGG